jgi:1,4-dihydroxy-2-naphthoyl-CoA hydrolase
MSDKQADAGPESASSEPVDLAVLKLMSSSALTDRMGIQLVQAAPELMIGTMPVEGNTQPYGLLHGGASCVLAETLGSIGAALHAARSGKMALGVDLNATHHRGVKSGLVTGTARAVQLGGTLASYEIVIVDDAGRRVCTARLTCILMPNPNA